MNQQQNYYEDNNEQSNRTPGFSRVYLKDALTLSEREQELRLEFSKWLPDELIDCHSHANGIEAVKKLSTETLKRVHSSFPDYSIQDSSLVLQTLYIDKQISSLRFANPYKGIDHKKANEYLLKNSPLTDKVALMGLPDEVDYTVSELETGQYTALKMYLYYFEPPVKKIVDFFPIPVLAVAQKLSIPIILHTPSPLSDCADEVLEIIYRFPRLSIVLAHLGRHTYANKKSFAAYAKLRPYPQVFTDTSMATSPDVLEQVIRMFGPERILFGTDEPFNLLRYTRYIHSKLGERLISTYPYHWLDESQRREYGYLAESAYHVHWQSLEAIRYCLANLYPNKHDRIKEKVFLENAKQIFPLF